MNSVDHDESKTRSMPHERLKHFAQLCRKEVDRLPGEKDRGAKTGYKFLEHADKHIDRVQEAFRQLDPPPGSSVFEIGPGCCYLLYLCRSLRNCRIAAIDIKLEWFVVYRTMRRLLDMEDVVREERVQSFQPVSFGRKYDRIVSTAATFDRDWDRAAHLHWLNDCMEHLEPNGQLVIAFNRPTVVNDDVMKLYRRIARFPKKYLAIVPQSAATTIHEMSANM